MSRHDDTIALRQMMDHAAEAVALSAGRQRGDLDQERLLALGLLKLVEIVGEASLRVETAFREAHPDLPWRELAGTRHHLVHGYDAVDYDILWNIVTLDFPPLVEKLKAKLSGR